MFVCLCVCVCANGAPTCIDGAEGNESQKDSALASPPSEETKPMVSDPEALHQLNVFLHALTDTALHFQEGRRERKVGALLLLSPPHFTPLLPCSEWVVTLFVVCDSSQS